MVLPLGHIVTMYVFGAEINFTFCYHFSYLNCFLFIQLFIRGAQKLSNKMRFNAMSSEQGPKTVSPIRSAKGDNRLLLQVPTLASMDANTPSRRFRHEDQSSADSQGGTGRPSTGPLNWTGYRAEDPYLDAKAWGHYYGDHSRMYSGAIYNHHSYHRAMPSDSVGPQAPLYSPPQVRSGRGAMRTTGAIRITTSSSPLTTPSLAARSSFPVSNRGKGRKNTGSRPAIPPADSFVPKDSHDTNSAQALAQASFEEAQRIGNSVNGIAIAISRKAKRKLPLSRKNDRDDQSTSLVAEEI